MQPVRKILNYVEKNRPILPCTGGERRDIPVPPRRRRGRNAQRQGIPGDRDDLQARPPAFATATLMPRHLRPGRALPELTLCQGDSYARWPSPNEILGGRHQHPQRQDESGLNEHAVLRPGKRRPVGQMREMKGQKRPGKSPVETTW